MTPENSADFTGEQGASQMIELGRRMYFSIPGLIVPLEHAQKLAPHIDGEEIDAYDVPNEPSVVLPGGVRGALVNLTVGGEFAIVRTLGPLKRSIVLFADIQALNPMLQMPSGITRRQLIVRTLEGIGFGALASVVPGIVHTHQEVSAHIAKNNQEIQDLQLGKISHPAEDENDDEEHPALMATAKVFRYTPHGVVVGGAIGAGWKKIAVLFSKKEKTIGSQASSEDQTAQIPSQKQPTQPIERQRLRSEVIERLTRPSDN